MPRPAKGIRLHPKGRGEKATWIIKDGDKRVSTGCSLSDRQGAEASLAEYITSRYQPERGRRGIDAIPLADVIAVYLTDVVAAIADEGQRRRAAARAERLLLFFGTKTLDQLNGSLCRAYRDKRGTDGGARRDLQDLSAAIQHHHREGYHREAVRVWLPPAGRPRERWLTRSELARLVWAAWSYRSPMPIPSRYRKDDPLPGIRRPAQHVARAILFAYYTGSRPGDVLRASFHAGAGRSYIDLDAGLFFRLPPDKAPTRKRQPPCRLSDRLMTHLRRWRDKPCVASHVVEYDGGPVLSITTSLRAAIDRAGLGGGVVAYTFRHSRATHMLQAGVGVWRTAEALGTSEEMIRRHYGHHDPSLMRDAVNVR